MFCFVSLAHAQISLPLQGYFHPRRTMPVRIDLQPAPRAVQFTGAVPIQISANAGGVLPLLTLGSSVRDPSGHELQSLQPDQRLVAAPAGMLDAVAKFFPNASIVRIDPPTFSGPADAWESLDAWCADAPPPREIDCGALLARGMTFVIHGTDKPATDLPWVRDGDFWIARPLAPPIEQLLGRAYAPVENWRIELSSAERWKIAGVATLVSLISLASLLYRGTGRLAVLCGTITACMVGVLVWRNRINPLHRVDGSVYVERKNVRQNDRWIYWRTVRPRSVHITERPLPVDAAQADDLHLREDVRSDAIRWQVDLRDDLTLACLRRRIEPASIALEVSKEPSPLSRLAENYASADQAVTPVRSTTTRDWPDVLVRSR